MKMNNWKVLSIALLMISPIHAFAFQVAVEGGLSLDTPSMTLTSGTAPTLSTKSSIAYGVAAGYSMIPGFQIESGLMFLPRHYTSTDGSSNVSEVSFNNWMVPLLARFTALPLLSVAAGPYYMMGTGQVSTTTTPAGGSAGNAAMSDFGSTIKNSGFGALASVRIEMPILPTLAFLIDGRYLMDLSDRSANSAQTLKFKDLQLLVGASFGF